MNKIKYIFKNILGSITVFFPILLLTIFFINGCSANKSYRNVPIGSTDRPASSSYLEENKTYDLAFVEFTDRGNVFNRENMENVIRHVQMNSQKGETYNGATVIVYAHGWHHNAEEGDDDITDFNQYLKASARQDPHRRIIGVYIGWRGNITVPYIDHLTTYWNRKKVAQNIGKGGVTELLLRLAKVTNTDRLPPEDNKKEFDPTRNIFVITGHSFGGALLLSALNEILLSKVINTEATQCEVDNKINKYKFLNICENKCVITQPFGHGVLLVNPSVEANEILQLKEVVSNEHCYAETQSKLLHVYSSKSDIATKLAFPMGQYLGTVIRSKEAILIRKKPIIESLISAEKKEDIEYKDFKIDEKTLDTKTIGNYFPYRTSAVKTNLNQESHFPCKEINKEGKKVILPDPCEYNRHSDVHMLVNNYEPLSFTFTDKGAIKDHNDIFTPYVASIITTIAIEAQTKRELYSTGKERDRTHCQKEYNNNNKKFHFKSCREYYQKEYENLTVHPKTK